MKQVCEKNIYLNSSIVLQSFPNPFINITTIRYYIENDCKINLSIFNFAGVKIATLIDKNQNKGFHEVMWHSIGFVNGIYSICLIVNEKRFLIKAIKIDSN